MVSSTSCLFLHLPSLLRALVVSHVLPQIYPDWLLYSSSLSLPNLSSLWWHQTYFSKTQVRTGYPFLYSRTFCISHCHQNYSSSWHGLNRFSIIMSCQTPLPLNTGSQNPLQPCLHPLLMPWRRYGKMDVW